MPDEDGPNTKSEPGTEGEPADSGQEQAKFDFLFDVGAARIWEASAELLDKLSDARPAWGGPHPRLAVVRSLDGVLTFLRTIDLDDPGDRSRPLGEFLGALNELEQGRLPELLRPATKDGRRPVSLRERTVQAQAVAVAEMLEQKTGMKLEAADAEVGKTLQEEGFPMGKLTTPNGKVVAGWREKLHLRDCDPWHRWVYEQMLFGAANLPPAADDDTRHVLRKKLLGQLGEEVRNRRGLGKRREE